MKKILLLCVCSLFVIVTHAKSNQPVTSPEPTGTEGACVVRGMHSSAPNYNDSNFGPSYAKLNLPTSKFKDGKATVQAAQALCTDAIFQKLQSKYCEMNTYDRQTQWTAQVNHADGSVYSSGCAASGCNYHPCPS